MADAVLLQKVEALLRAAESCGFGLLEYAEGSLELRVAFDVGLAGAATAVGNAPPSALPDPYSLESQTASSSHFADEAARGPQPIPPLEVEMPGKAEGGRPKLNETLHPARPQALQSAITSPGVGFFRCLHPAGGKLPSEGDEVAGGAVVALIQAGPLLQPVVAPRAGRLGKMLVTEGVGVGFGAALFEFA